MEPNASLRLASIHDIKAIFDIRTNVVENHLSISELAEMGITQDFIKTQIRQSYIYVVETESKVVGFSMFDPLSGYLSALFVERKNEGKGFGRELLRISEKELFKACDNIYLETANTSRAAQFYLRNGWLEHRDEGNGDSIYIKYKAGKSSSTDL